MGYRELNVTSGMITGYREGCTAGCTHCNWTMGSRPAPLGFDACIPLGRMAPPGQSASAVDAESTTGRLSSAHPYSKISIIVYNATKPCLEPLQREDVMPGLYSIEYSGSANCSSPTSSADFEVTLRHFGNLSGRSGAWDVKSGAQIRRANSLPRHQCGNVVWLQISLLLYFCPEPQSL